MSENFGSKFDRIDDLMQEVDFTVNSLGLLSEAEDLCDEIDGSLDSRKQEVTTWPNDRKRSEATDSRDPYVLNLLSMDGDFNVRVLSICNPNAPVNSLRRLVETGDDYVRMIIANNPNSSSDILDRIAELSGEQEVLDAVNINPNALEVTKYKIENRM